MKIIKHNQGMEIELALEEGLVWDEIYRKVYEIVANCEYSDMRAVNPAYSNRNGPCPENNQQPPKGRNFH